MLTEAGTADALLLCPLFLFIARKAIRNISQGTASETADTLHARRRLAFALVLMFRARARGKWLMFLSFLTNALCLRGTLNTCDPLQWWSILHFLDSPSSMVLFPCFLDHLVSFLCVCMYRTPAVDVPHCFGVHRLNPYVFLSYLLRSSLQEHRSDPPREGGRTDGRSTVVRSRKFKTAGVSPQAGCISSGCDLAAKGGQRQRARERGSEYREAVLQSEGLCGV